MSEMVVIPGVELMAVGYWNRDAGYPPITRRDLQLAIQASECPSVGNPIVQLGHADPRFDGEPALGSVMNLRLNDNGTKLIGDLRVLRWLGESVSASYPNRSVQAERGFRCQIGHSHPVALTHLALLGVTKPGIGTLKSLDDVKQLLTASKGEPNVRNDGDYADIVQDYNAGRIIGEQALTRLIEQRQRDIRAHSHQQALQQAHEALDRGHQANYTEDDFKKLFNPNSKDGPLGPEEEDDDPNSLTGPHGHYQPKINRPVEDQQKRASAYAAEDVQWFRQLYGRNPKPGELDD